MAVGRTITSVPTASVLDIGAAGGIRGPPTLHSLSLAGCSMSQPAQPLTAHARMAKHLPGPCSGIPPPLCVHRQEPLTYAFLHNQLAGHPLPSPCRALGSSCYSWRPRSCSGASMSMSWCVRVLCELCSIWSVLVSTPGSPCRLSHVWSLFHRSNESWSSGAARTRCSVS